ncbi:14382_t:CDS:2, partial [Racocetra persica]
ESINAGDSKLCYPKMGKNITCFMNTHVENVSSVPARFYGDYMHKSLAIYGGHILIPQCVVNSVGCVNSNENDVIQVQKRFVELLYRITASGVMARRSLLSNRGIIMNVQSVEKGEASIIIKFEKRYYLTVIAM